MNKKLFLIPAFLLLAAAGSGQEPGNALTGVILSGYSERSYTTEPVSGEQLDLILQCGIRAPSSRNQQPWRFTVIDDEATMKEIVSQAVAGNVLIIVSGAESATGGTPDFDCGLATESMFLAAHSLGLGARIYGSPVGGINDRREHFRIPAGYKAVMILRIGKADKSVDAVTAATPRKSFEEVVNFRK